MEELSIRKATTNDIETLKQFEQGLIAAERNFTDLLKPDPIYYNMLDEMLANPDIDFLVAEIDGRPVACGYLRIENAKHFYKFERQAYLGMMYVVPEHRGVGINSDIIDALKEAAKQRHVTELCLEVFNTNSSAIRAYEKAGFTKQIVQMRMSLN